MSLLLATGLAAMAVGGGGVVGADNPPKPRCPLKRVLAQDA